MNLYTLRHPMTGDRAYLNGKIFVVKKDSHAGNVAFVFQNEEGMWITTPVTSVNYTSDGVDIVTHNTKYELINVSNLLPTKKEGESTDDTSENTEEPKLPLVLNTRSVTRGIDYGDGYQGVVVNFASEVSYDDFLKYLEQEDYDLRRLEGAAWYEDHAAILRGSIKSGDRVGRHLYANSTDKPYATWTYLWIRAYTD